MSTSISVHDVTRVVVGTSERTGTKWTTLTVYDNSGDPALELTLFNAYDTEAIQLDKGEG
jgi:hypothetical protein